MSYICRDCPRNCGAERPARRPSGRCGSPFLPRISRAAPHCGEEPCISGSRGSGAVFFTGCSLGCRFCQNAEISVPAGGPGKILTVAQLRDLFLRLQDSGVHNLNLVTASHYVLPAARALELARLRIPVVWNSSGYEKPETLRRLEGLVQIYLPDFKFADRHLAEACANAPDYPEIAKEAIREMFRQTGPYQLRPDGLLQSGVLIRYLVLPGYPENAKSVIDWIARAFSPGTVLFSLMSQFTPMPRAAAIPHLSQKVGMREYRRLEAYARDCGLSEGYFQDPSSATEQMIPKFDLTGIAER